MILAALACTAVTLADQPKGAPARPANDACAAGTVIIGDTFNPAPYDIGGANAIADEPQESCEFLDLGVSNSVFYTFTPDVDGVVVIDTNGSTYDTVLSIFDGCGDFVPDPPGPDMYVPPDEIACDDDGGMGVASALVGVPLDAGVTYIIKVAHWSTNPVASGLLDFNFAFHPYVDIVAANPPLDNPYVPGIQPFRDVLDTGTGATLTAGIGAIGTPAEGSISFAPISVSFDGPPFPAPTTANVTILCTGSPANCPTVASVSGAGAGPYSITLSGPIPPGECTTLTFAGTNSPGGGPPGSLRYQSQPGNLNQDPTTTNTQDLLALINALNNGDANQPTNVPRYNVNRSTNFPNPVNTQDLLRLIQLLNGTNTTQPFNGAGVAACP